MRSNNYQQLLESEMMDKEQMIKRMNECGKEKRPFLFAVDFEMRECVFVADPLNQDRVLFRTPLGGNLPKGGKRLSGVRFERSPEPYERYKERFGKVQDGLRRGDSFLTNLTVRTPIEMNVTLRDIAEANEATFSLYVPERFVCFSPERFVKIDGDEIYTYPMKGTIDASVADAEKVIMQDEKETAEHNTIVDLLRNDIGIVANDVTVTRFRYIEELKTNEGNILQTSSEIRGRIGRKGIENLGDVIYAMLPAGSVSGAPKKSTLEIIAESEDGPRGFYSGVFGYYDGERFDSAVMIRYIEQYHGRYYFRSGGGITVKSDSETEYAEVIQKIYLPL